MIEANSDECALCDGWGYINHDVSQQCPSCGGTGKELFWDTNNGSNDE